MSAEIPVTVLSESVPAHSYVAGHAATTLLFPVYTSYKVAIPSAKPNGMFSGLIH